MSDPGAETVFAGRKTVLCLGCGLKHEHLPSCPPAPRLRPEVERLETECAELRTERDLLKLEGDALARGLEQQKAEVAKLKTDLARAVVTTNDLVSRRLQAAAARKELTASQANEASFRRALENALNAWRDETTASSAGPDPKNDHAYLDARALLASPSPGAALLEAVRFECTHSVPSLSIAGAKSACDCCQRRFLALEKVAR